MESALKSLIVGCFISMSWGGLATAEPLYDMLEACDLERADPKTSAVILSGMGWSDVTSEASYSKHMVEQRFIEARARLSRASYPDMWNNETVSSSYSSKEATNVEDILSRIVDGTSQSWESAQYLGIFVLSANDANASVAMIGNGCYFVGKSAENPTIAEGFAKTAFQPEGGRKQPLILDGLPVTAILLSEHAQSADPRFPINHDLSLIYNPMRPLQ